MTAQTITHSNVETTSTGDLILFYNQNTSGDLAKSGIDRATIIGMVTRLLDAMTPSLDEIAAAVMATSGKAVSPATRMAEEALKAQEVESATGKPIPLTKVNQEILDRFLELRNLAVAEAITATAAIHRVMESFPQVTRKDLKHAAAAAGINPLTARNTFDRIRSSAK